MILQREALVIQRSIGVATVGWRAAVMLKGSRTAVDSLVSLPSQCFLIFHIIVFEEH